MLTEEVERAVPCHARILGIEAWRGVIVKAVLATLIGVNGHCLAGPLQLRLIGRIGSVDPLVDAGQGDQQGRLDFRDIGERCCPAIIGR